MSLTTKLLGGSSAVDPTYVEDVFSTYLYTGTGAAQTLVNGIDLATKGGMLWTGGRTTINYNTVYDTVRSEGGYPAELRTYTTNAQAASGSIASFNSNGYSLNADVDNVSGRTYASWTFRKQPKFFDVVTYTGNGVDRDISHNLASVPGCIIIKRTDSTGDWIVYHRGLSNSGSNYSIKLNTTAAQINQGGLVATSTTFTLYNAATVNTNGATYVAYLYAHNAGGFGATGTDNVVSCGSFTVDGTGSATVNLGFEPQWILYKPSNRVVDWTLTDTMRGWHPQTTVNPRLVPNTSAAETTSNDLGVSSTGFYSLNNLSAGDTIIYIAIRRGPMKVPTDGTKVFAPIAVTNSAGSNNTTNFPVDLQINSLRSAASKLAVDRLRGVSTTDTNIGSQLVTNSTAAEAGSGAGAITRNWSNTGFQTSDEYGSLSTIYWNFRRAPGFFDEVCYTGDDANGRAVTHNLTATPELMIVKSRSASAAPSWWVWNASTSGGLILNSADASSIYNWSPTDTPTSTTFKVSRSYGTNYVSVTYVAYLFASCPGVSKVGSYTGTGATQTIACGFAGGARFVLIKRTDSTGDWYVWDTARGMVAGTDPKLALNTTAAETNANWVYTATTGFQIVTTDASVNASGGSYIFLAIA